MAKRGASAATARRPIDPCRIEALAHLDFQRPRFPAIDEARIVALGLFGEPSLLVSKFCRGPGVPLGVLKHTYVACVDGIAVHVHANLGRPDPQRLLSQQRDRRARHILPRRRDDRWPQ